ncbi:Alpha/Beta hydrolase protein [Mycena amicta]|nr:Alpha/Beta hydrolase protein [Mycena amicta]
MLASLPLYSFAVHASMGWAASIGRPAAVVNTTSGQLEGSLDGGVMSFKGIRFSQPPIGELRWEAPIAFTSTSVQNTTTLGPSCVQQFPFPIANLHKRLFNNPEDPPAESEDCLFINVWAPAPKRNNLPVVFWIYGGGLAFGTASLPFYDGTSFAQNQDVIFVSFNYRTNVFGFPGSPELPLTGNNLGYMDQEMALQWVQQNIAQFGGDPGKVTIMGQSAGGLLVGTAIAQYTPGTAPFRAAIALSGTQPSLSPTPAFGTFNAFSVAVGCGDTPGSDRLACLKAVPALAIHNYTNAPEGAASFRPTVDNVTVFANPLQRIRTGRSASVPLIIGNMQDDGTLFTIGLTNLTSYLAGFFGTLVTVDQVRPLYPGLNDSQIIPEVQKDFVYKCPAKLWSAAIVGAGVADVYRYSYGAVFADLQVFPNGGAYHGTELREIFGTYNRSTATGEEATLSQTMQRTIANFVKNPAAAPAPNWAKYVPGNRTTTLAKLAYNGNVLTTNLVQSVESDSTDGPCSLWDTLLD